MNRLEGVGVHRPGTGELRHAGGGLRQRVGHRNHLGLRQPGQRVAVFQAHAAGTQDGETNGGGGVGP